jgi:iron complex outermembrane recepter protein
LSSFRNQPSRRVANPPILLFGALSLLCTNVVAEEETKKLEKIDVTASKVSPYATDAATSSTKSASPLIETPQSISVVTRELMDVQGVQSLSDVLRYVPGVLPQASGRRGFDDFIIRGFSQSAYAFRDGLRSDPGFLTEQETFGLERVDVVKGPGSVLFGQVAPGGLINLVSKKPRLYTREGRHMVEGGVGTYSATRVAADTQGPIDAGGTLAYRLVALYSDREDAIDSVSFRRQYIAPSLAWRIGPATTMTLLSLYQQDEFTRAGALPARGTALPNPNGSIPLNRFIGEPGFDRLRLPQWQIGYLFEHQFRGGLRFQQALRRTGYKLTGQNLNPGTIAANGLTLGRVPIILDIDNDFASADSQLAWTANTGALRNELLAGVDYQRFRNRQTQRQGTVAALNLFNPVYGAGVTPAAAFNNNRRQIQKQEGFYLQNNAKFYEQLVVLAGIRRDSARDDTLNYLNNSRSIVAQSATTGRLGALWIAPGGFSPYVSYAESFVPVVANPLRDGSSVKPEEGEQTEAGLKWSPRDGGIQATLARFDLKRRNVVSADPTSNTFSVQTGEQRHKGWEAEVNARVSSVVDFVASYAMLDAVVTSSTTGNQGKRPQNAPRHTASVWSTWKITPLTPGLEVGIGARYVSARQGDALNTYQIPGYTVSDAALRYSRGQWRLQLNARNLADKQYFIGTSGASNVTVAERRVVSASMQYVF